MIKLVRFAHTPMGVFGKMTFNGFECYTVERPWLDNRTNVSCIPEDTYTARLYDSPTPGRGIVWQLNDVPDRTFIQIHRGNTMDDVVGCIALGKGLGFVNGKWAVSSSRQAFGEFMDSTEMFDEISISISHYIPEEGGEEFL